MDELVLVVEGGLGGILELDGVTIVEVKGLKVSLEDGRAVVEVPAGLKLTIRAERPEPR